MESKGDDNRSTNNTTNHIMTKLERFLQRNDTESIQRKLKEWRTDDILHWYKQTFHDNPTSSEYKLLMVIESKMNTKEQYQVF